MHLCKKIWQRLCLFNLQKKYKTCISKRCLICFNLFNGFKSKLFSTQMAPFNVMGHNFIDLFRFIYGFIYLSLFYLFIYLYAGIWKWLLIFDKFRKSIPWYLWRAYPFQNISALIFDCFNCSEICGQRKCTIEKVIVTLKTT